MKLRLPKWKCRKLRKSLRNIWFRMRWSKNYSISILWMAHAAMARQKFFIFTDDKIDWFWANRVVEVLFTKQYRLAYCHQGQNYITSSIFAWLSDW
jgi:hypothetical protein